MRVLHVGPTPFFSDRGCHIRIRGLIGALSRKGISSRLCTYHHGADVEGVETIRIPSVPFYHQVQAGPAPLKYIADVLLLFRVLAETVRWRPDIIHGHLHEGALLGWIASTLLFWRKIPVVFDMQGSLTGELKTYGYFQERPLMERAFERLEEFISQRPSAIACSSQAGLEIARNRFGVPGERLRLVLDGYDAMNADPERVARLRRVLGLGEREFIVVFSGSLLPIKGLQILHEVIRLTAEQDLQMHFLIVGFPTESTEAFLKGHGLEDICTLTGRVPFSELGNYLDLATVAIDPKEEGSGEASGKILNYMAAGLPVVCFDQPNNRRMLGDLGSYAPPVDPEGLVTQLENLRASPQLRGEIREGLLHRVCTEFDWDRSASSLVDIYRAVGAA
jgi:glycosyltransferase involved in cell wall biosynthesis